MLWIKSRQVVRIVLAFLLLCADISIQARVKTRCYDDPPIGCFSNEHPYDNTFFRPSSIKKIDLHYIHYTETDRQRLSWREVTEVMRSRFRPDLKTCVIIHGWIEYYREDWLISMTRELAQKEPMNIFVVDWHGGARVMSYLLGIANGRVVAAMVGLFFKDLQALGADLSTFHLIGNSLGAHVCGHIGASLPGIGRISGLDPSGRAMANRPTEARLDPTDALFVDVIHTDGKKISGFGTFQPMGHIDIYVNGGTDQPACAKTLLGIIYEMVILGLGFNKCSHIRAKLLFIASINDWSIKAHQCDSLENALDMTCGSCTHSGSCVEFGYDLTPGATGVYSVITAKSSVSD